MNTYITSAEATIIIANGTDYTTDEQNYALEQSYLLTNSFIKSSVRIPDIEVYDGSQNTINAPAVLKQAQTEFVRYLLAKITYIWSEDLQNQYDNNVKMLQELRDGQLALETQVYNTNVGCSIVSNNNLVGSGTLEVLSNYNGVLEDYYIIQIDNATAGLRFPYSIYNTSNVATFKWKTKSSNWQQTLQTCYSDAYTQIGEINIRFIGSLSAGEEGTVHCIPNSEVNSVDKNGTTLLHQSMLNY